jgi:hypothetical protein
MTLAMDDNSPLTLILLLAAVIGNFYILVWAVQAARKEGKSTPEREESIPGQSSFLGAFRTRGRNSERP